MLRSLSPLKLKKLLAPFSLTTCTYATRPVSNLLHSSSLLVRFRSSQNPTKPLPFLFRTAPFSSQPVNDQSSSSSSSSLLPLTRDGNYEEANEHAFPICPGCGIHMQDVDRQQPGFFVNPSNKPPFYKKFKRAIPITDESEISNPLERGVTNEITDTQMLENLETENKVFDEMPKRVENLVSIDEKEANEKAITDESEISDLITNEITDTERIGNLETEDHVFDEMPKRDKNLGNGPDEKEASEKPIVCSRCHNLKYHGKVAHPSVESLLPDFDFNHTVGKRIMSTIGARSVVLLVVDAVDFDGSFPKKVVDLVSKTVDENAQSWKEGKPGNIPWLILVVSKIDLLPTNTSPMGLENWFRTRAREAGAGKLASIHLVSSARDWGIKNLVDDVVKLAGERGNVWAVGAQNAGKSTLINAIGKCVGAKGTCLTEAPLLGTTLGIVKVEGLLPGKAKLFDTPGILHSHQISSRLTDNEHKLIRIQKELKPRTYRIKAGHSVHIGGLLRLDIEESSVDSIYVTVWASPFLTLHMGKTESACTIPEKHFGRQLKPPMGKGRFEELGKWVKKEFRVTGNWWDSSAVDIAAAGLGWFAIGLKGEARLGVWTYDGVDVIVRNALLPQRSHSFEVAGFSVSEIASKADKATTSKKKGKNGKKSKEGINSTKEASPSNVADVANVGDVANVADVASNAI